MVEAIIIARRFLNAEGITTTCEPDVVDLTIGEVERPAIRFTAAVVGTASVPQNKEAQL